METRSQRFIRDNARTMRSATEYFNLDTNLMTMEDYEKAALRLLVVFPSPATTKSVSMTASVLNDFVISECPGVFIDFAFVPEQDDLSTFDKYMMPYAIGNITGLDASHYDLVGFSISILFEAMTTAMIVNSFSRCDRPIPLTWSERKDHKFGETPALYLGGITASVTDVLFGDVGDGRQAFVDFIHLGEFHCVKDFFDHCIESKKLGRTVQENLDTFWPLSPSHNWLYQPQAYEVKYNDRNQIISNIKINPNAPDMCQPYYPDEIPNLNGAARGIIQGNGGNAGLGQFMAANGCSRSGFCNFCHEGAFTGGWVENTPDRLVELAKIARRYTAATTLKAYSFNCVSEDTPVITEEGIKRASQLSGNEKVVTPYGYSDFILNKGTSDSLEHLIMSQGADLKLTPNHRQLVLSDIGVVEVPAKDVKVGDWIPFTVGTARTVARNSIWFALGLWYGDGCSTGNSNYFLFNLFEVGNAKNISPWIQSEARPTSTPSVCSFLATKEFTRKVREIFPNGKEDISNLYSLGLQELVDFVQGLFDADGSGVKGWLKITQKASRKELLNLVSTVLLSVGVRTSFSPRIDVTLPGRQKVYSRYDLRVVGQESRIAFLQTFNNHTGKLDYVNCEDRISNRDLCIPPLVGVILAKEFVRVFGKIPSGFNRSKFFKGIKGITVSKFLEMFAQYKEVIPIVNDIVNGTRFAKVVSRETLKGSFPVVDVCETTGGVFNIAGFWTHNSNYLSDYKRSIYDWMSIFPHVTFNNMRLEELGLDPDALKMMKLSGYKRMTAPLEGVSQRVRNNFLNKNLSEKAIDAYLTYGMMMGAVECKIGIVLTGFEEDQDWQEFFDFNDKWQKKAREMGGKIPFRYNMTYLVHYPHTPAEFWERKSVRTALYGGFLMPYKWNKRMTDNKIRIKINGFKHSTLIEQALIDLGRELTSWLYQYLVKPGYPIYSFKPVVNRKEAWEELVSRINIDYFFNERKFDEYISVSHRIHVALHANVILQAMRTLQGGLNAQPTIRCLKTYDGCPVECKANAFARNPLITYGDAWINDKGKLEGVVWEEVKGCQRCKTVEDRKKILTRTLPKSKTANDILSFKAPALRLRLRFRVERNEPYDILSPRNTAFSSLSMFLKESQELTDMFWELENNYNMYWQSEKEYFYTASGQLVYDVTFRDRKAKEIVESLIETVNAKAKTFRVIAVSEVPIDSQIKPTDLNVFYFESTIPAELWQYASMMYKGEVKAEDESGMMATKTDSSLRPPQFTLEDKVKGYFVLPCRYSPWCYLQGLMSSKRVALRKLLKTTKVRCLTTVRETNIPCVCGKENAVVDMATGLYKPVGLDCLVNWFTNNIKK